MRYYIVLYVTGTFTDQEVNFSSHRYYQVGEVGSDRYGRFRILKFVK